MSGLQPSMNSLIGGYIRVGLLMRIDSSTARVSALFQRALRSLTLEILSSYRSIPVMQGCHAVNLLKLYPDVSQIANALTSMTNNYTLSTSTLGVSNIRERALCREDDKNQ